MTFAEKGHIVVEINELGELSIGGEGQPKTQKFDKMIYKAEYNETGKGTWRFFKSEKGQWNKQTKNPEN